MALLVLVDIDNVQRLHLSKLALVYTVPKRSEDQKIQKMAPSLRPGQWMAILSHFRHDIHLARTGAASHVLARSQSMQSQRTEDIEQADYSD